MKKLAEIASKQLDYKLNLRELLPNKTTGLTVSEEVCKQHEIDYPTYDSRGRWDDGNYISIEYTNAYQGFTPGYYIIVVSSFGKENPELTLSLEKVKKHYKTAYIKYADIYMGCMH